MKNRFWAPDLKFRGYKSLLYALVITLLAFPVLEGFTLIRIITGLLILGLLLIAVRAVANHRNQILLTGILGAAGIIGYFGELLGFGDWLRGLSLLGFGLFFLTVGVIIMTNIMLHIRHVTAHLIYGAINLYLVIGLSFAFLIALIEFLQAGSFSGLQKLTMGGDHIAPYVYYSFVTMTTLGYGDITPVTGPAATLVYIEAIFGQLYIAIMIARLVGLYVAKDSSRE
jgi:hypothetical protein